MRCAICDDDYSFLQSLHGRLAAYCGQKAIDCECQFFITPSEFLLAAMSEAPVFDIVFLNVDNGFWDGINIARTIRRAGSQMMIIFVSDHVDFALEGYNVGAFRYLMKADLDKTFTDAMDAAVANLAPTVESIKVKSGKETLRIFLSDIAYAESMKRTITFVFADGRPPLTVYKKLSDLEEELGGKGFLRVHKSYLVNMLYVETIKNYHVFLEDGTQLPTTRQNYAELQDVFNGWREKEAANALPN